MRITKTRDVKTPNRGTAGSAGIDFFVPNKPIDKHVMGPGVSVKIPAGVHVQVPKGMALVMMNKSGVATKKGLIVGACVVDHDYQGEVHIHVINTTNHTVEVHAGEKLVQGLLIPVLHSGIEEVETLEELYDGEITERGAGGFGSTGTK